MTLVSIGLYSCLTFDVVTLDDRAFVYDGTLQNVIT